MDITKFRTPQEIIAKDNPSPDGSWLLAIDAGYSGVKGFAPDKYFCFPASVKRVEGMISVPNDRDIIYRDDTGTYLVGELAQEQVMAGDTSGTDSDLFSRGRYSTRNFNIMVRAGIAIGISNAGGKKCWTPGMPIKIQTGLPTKYLIKNDIEQLKKAFAVQEKFDIKIGKAKWRGIDLDIKPEDISVMAQPSGTLYNLVIGEDGKFTKDAASILEKNIFIADVGFGTFDPYGLVNRIAVVKESVPDMGMKRIMERVVQKLYEDTGEDVSISGLQKHITKGYYPVLDTDTMTTKDIGLAPYFEAAMKETCAESIEAIRSMANNLRDYEILVPTGGTGEAWYGIYRDYFAGMKGLTVMKANRNDNLPMLYSNVRGYYMRHYKELSKAGGKK